MQILNNRLGLCIMLLCLKQIWCYGASQIWLVVLFLICVNTSVSSVCFSAFVSLFCVLCLTDLEDFKTHRRSPVRVREGQGVVLLCGPPPHSGGNMAHRVAVFIALLQSQSFPLRANISTPRSAKSWALVLHRNTSGLSLFFLIFFVFIGTKWKVRCLLSCWGQRTESVLLCHSLACQLSFLLSRGKLLAQMLEKMSVCGCARLRLTEVQTARGR